MSCLACDLAAGVRELPGGLIHSTVHWRVEHCVGPLGVGTLIVKPTRHVEHVADLREDEAAELGPLLRLTSAVVGQLSEAEQVYVCLWSHGPVHIHFVVQPETNAAMVTHDAYGPRLQVALFEEGASLDSAAVSAFADRARRTVAQLVDLRAPDITVEALELSTPTAVRDAFPAFAWDVRQLWALRLPIVDMPIADFDWLLELPLWRWQGQRFVLSPAEVRAEPERYQAHRDKAEAADLGYPIHVSRHGGRWVILDGYHRLLKAVMRGHTSIAAMRVEAKDLA